MIQISFAGMIKNGLKDILAQRRKERQGERERACCVFLGYKNPQHRLMEGCAGSLLTTAY